MGNELIAFRERKSLSFGKSSGECSIGMRKEENREEMCLPLLLLRGIVVFVGGLGDTGTADGAELCEERFFHR